MSFIAVETRAAETEVVVKAGRGVGKVTIHVEKGCLVIDVFSPGGIGQISVQSGGQPWPMAAKLRLHYNERRGFTHLEGFTLTDSKDHLKTFLGSENVELDRADGGTELVPLTELQGKPLSDFKLEKANGAVEVTLPMRALADETAFDVHWIDFYRN